MSTIKVDTIQTRNGTDAIGVDLSSSGNAIDFKLSGTTIGNIGVISDRVYLTAEGSHGVYLDASANNFCPSSTTGTDDNGNIDLGASFARWKDVHFAGDLKVGTSQKGIDFTNFATSDSAGDYQGTPSSVQSVLFDYEQGTFPAQLCGTTGSVGSGAGLSSTGHYTKIGRSVHIMVTFQVTNRGSWTGDAQVRGLPFKCHASHNFPITVGFNNFSGTNSWYVVSHVTASQSYIYLADRSSAAISGGYQSTIQSVAGTSDIYTFNGWYMTND